MWKDLFSGAVLLDLPIVVMLAFLALFVGVVLWTHGRRRRPHYDLMSRLPLDLEPESDPRHDSPQEARRHV